MSYHKLLYLLIFQMLILSVACSSKEQGAAELVTPELKVSLAFEPSDDKTKQARISFVVSNGWHIYGPKPQNNGRPTSVNLYYGETQLNEISWPGTSIFDEGLSGPSDGFESSFQVTAKIPAEIVPETTLKAKVSWVACRDICVPGVANLEISR